jgi:hypothetical protein
MDELINAQVIIRVDGSQALAYVVSVSDDAIVVERPSYLGHVTIGWDDLVSATGFRRQ